MKILSLILVLLLLTGCGSAPVATVSPEDTAPTASNVPVQSPVETIPAPEYVSRFASVTEITLSDEGITVNGGSETEAVFTSRDIIYYEDKDAYGSGNPYGEGETWQRHSSEEAAAHLVVNITEPGAYRVTGTLSKGQLRIDLGETSYDDPGAVVELILRDADIACTVAPAILFLNTYECDGNWSVDGAKPEVDTTNAGANLILEGKNTVTGSHVARIYKDQEGEKKLWKQDGALYSYRSMNVFGPGSLDLTADNEGLDTELHLTINSGSIIIRSDNDGINTNEDGVSVTTINGGSVTILAGLGEEGDGIDSNGYLTINGGTVVASANPTADAGLDSDLGSYIHGGTVVALGSTMDWAESDSRQVTMNLQFLRNQSAGSVLEIRSGERNVFSFDPAAHSVLSEVPRQYQGAILSCPEFRQGKTYSVLVNGVQQSYSGTDVGMGPGGFGGHGGMGGQRPGMGDREVSPEMPEGSMNGGFGGGRGQRPEGEMPQMPNGERPELPDGEMPTMPEGMEPPDDHFRGQSNRNFSDESSTEFYMADMVNAFSGVATAEA